MYRPTRKPEAIRSQLDRLKNFMENHRNRLRLLVERHGGPSELARRLGYKSGAWIVQMAGPYPTRDVSERTARKIEHQLGLPEQWMDEPVSPRLPVLTPTSAVEGFPEVYPFTKKNRSGVPREAQDGPAKEKGQAEFIGN